MTGQGWSTAKVAVVLYPIGAGAMAVNVFLVCMTGSWIGLPVLSTLWFIAMGTVMGVPAARAFARHIRGLMDKAEP